MEDKLNEIQKEDKERFNQDLHKISNKIVFCARLAWCMVFAMSLTTLMIVLGVTGAINNLVFSISSSVACGLSMTTFLGSLVYGVNMLEKEARLKKQIALIEKQNKLTQEEKFNYLNTNEQTSEYSLKCQIQQNKSIKENNSQHNLVE